MASNPHQQTCFSFFVLQKSFNKPFEFLLYSIKQIDNIFLCVCTVIFHRRVITACKEQQSHHSTSSCVILFCSLHAVTLSVIYYSTHTRKNVLEKSIKYLLNKDAL